MTDLVVKPVSTRKERRQFLGFPWSLYRDDPNWVPPLRMDQKELAGYAHHPFYERNRAQTFLATRGGEVCGRIAAIHNHAHVEIHKEPRGFFGFFECVDDQQVADALFDAARAWLAEQGLTSMRGPMSPGINYVLGTLVEGFDSPPTFLMAYNPPYYPRLIEGYGFRKSQDLYAFWANRQMLPASMEKHWPIADQIVERYGVTLRELDRSRFREDVETFLEVYNRSMVAHWSFVPMSPAEVRHAARSLQWLIVPELAMAAEIDGKPVGAVFGLPDYNPRIKRIDGRLFPFGVLRLLWKKRSIRRVRLLAANVLPEYQLHGIALVLLKALVPKNLACGFEEVEYSWIAESNAHSRGALEKGGAKRIKTYRVYDLEP
jgi:GNAT superfamily N-acetyltransferase